MLGCDAGQTAWMRNDGKWNRAIPGLYDAEGRRITFVETNPILGPRPSAIVADAYLGAFAVALPALEASNAPEWVKDAAVAAVAVMETANVYNNARQFRPTTAGTCGI